MQFPDRPDGPMVKNQPANAGDTGLMLDPRRSPVARGQLSPGKPMHHSYRTCALGPRSCRERSHCNEKLEHHNEDPAQPKIK